jgi:hypothetical protein
MPPVRRRKKAHHHQRHYSRVSNATERPTPEDVATPAERARARKRRQDVGRRLYKLMARGGRRGSTNATDLSPNAANEEDPKLVQALLMPTTGEGWSTALLNTLAESCGALPVSNAAQLDPRQAQSLHRMDAIVTAVDDRVEAVAGLRAFALLLSAEERRLRRRPPGGVATSAALAIANLPKLPRNPISRAAYERCVANGNGQTSDASGSDGSDADDGSVSTRSTSSSGSSVNGRRRYGGRRSGRRDGRNAEPQIQLGADWFFLDSADNVRSLSVLQQLWLLQVRLRRMGAIQAALLQARNAQCRAQGVATQMSIAAITCIVRQQQAHDAL